MGIALIPFTLAFTAAVLGVHALPALPSALPLAVLGAAALLPWRGRGLSSAVALGALLAVWQAQVQLQQRWPSALHGTDHVVEGFVASLPERNGEAQRFRFEPAAPGWPRAIRVA